jgi:glycosyltransferase involved in cell wall biosynthesis
MKESTNISAMSGRKNILIFNPSSLYPVNGSYQLRVINQIKCLSQKHDVTLLFLFRDKHSKDLTCTELEKFCKKIIPIQTITQSLIFKLIRKLFLKKLFYVLSLPFEHFSLSNFISARQIARYIDRNTYDIVVTHYWKSAGFFNHLKKPVPIKSIDTHYVVEEELDNLNNGSYNHLNVNILGKHFSRELVLQNKYFEISDLLIVNSTAQKDIINKSFPDKEVLVIPNGQSLEPYLNYPQENSDLIKKNILFYGALSNEYNGTALKRILYNILPKLKLIIPDINLIILGHSPPEWIKNAKNQENISITGFVEDIRPIFAKSYLTLLPLVTGGGFRGRTIELMGMGIPIIGTHNALDCLNMINGKHSFIIDDDDGIVDQVVTLINDPKLREQISFNEKAFVFEQYSIEATFGRLSDYLHNYSKLKTIKGK